MGAPSINIAFIEKSASAIQRGERGTVALLLKEKIVEDKDFTVYSVADIPGWLSESNREQVEMALKGYQNAPKKILAYVMEEPSEADGGGVPEPGGETDREGETDQEGQAGTLAESDRYQEALNYFETLKWDYLAVPSVEEDGKMDTVASWIKSQRTNNKKTFKAVLPNSPSDCEGIVNVANGCRKGDKEYPAAKMCARVAGLICGTPLTISCTYAPLPEMTDCDKLGKEELDAGVDKGKFLFVWDGEKVKACRGVTSFVTVADGKGKSFKKIKIVDAMDLMHDDIRITVQDSYTGKYPNSYDNKCVLITAINGYLSGLVRDGILASGSCQIALDAQREYLMGEGGLVAVDGKLKKLENCTDEEVKRANTGSHVFLEAVASIQDAMEDFDFKIYIG